MNADGQSRGLTLGPLSFALGSTPHQAPPASLNQCMRIHAGSTAGPTPTGSGKQAIALFAACLFLWHCSSSYCWLPSVSSSKIACLNSSGPIRCPLVLDSRCETATIEAASPTAPRRLGLIPIPLEHPRHSYRTEDEGRKTNAAVVRRPSSVARAEEVSRIGIFTSE